MIQSDIKKIVENLVQTFLDAGKKVINSENVELKKINDSK